MPWSCLASACACPHPIAMLAIGMVLGMALLMGICAAWSALTRNDH
jgi:hypothetical protein